MENLVTPSNAISTPGKSANWVCTKTIASKGPRSWCMHRWESTCPRASKIQWRIIASWKESTRSRKLSRSLLFSIEITAVVPLCPLVFTERDMLATWPFPASPTWWIRGTSYLLHRADPRHVPWKRALVSPKYVWCPPIPIKYWSPVQKNIGTDNKQLRFTFRFLRFALLQRSTNSLQLRTLLHRSGRENGNASILCFLEGSRNGAGPTR